MRKKIIVMLILFSLTIILLLLIVKCNQNNIKKNENGVLCKLDSLEHEADIDIFNMLYVNSDTLNLYADISDCGEFGGHKEIIKIYSDRHNHRYNLNYKKYGIYAKKKQNSSFSDNSDDEKKVKNQRQNLRKNLNFASTAKENKMTNGEQNS